jgi:hypothetical protein
MYKKRLAEQFPRREQFKDLIVRGSIHWPARR